MTECAHCSKKLKTAGEYAQHIIDKHPSDEIRVAWANHILHPQPEPDKKKRWTLPRWHGRDARLTPPKQLPDYLRKQIEEVIEEKRVK
jgi:hypothetical protein